MHSQYVDRGKQPAYWSGQVILFLAGKCPIKMCDGVFGVVGGGIPVWRAVGGEGERAGSMTGDVYFGQREDKRYSNTPKKKNHRTKDGDTEALMGGVAICLTIQSRLLHIVLL